MEKKELRKRKLELEIEELELRIEKLKWELTPRLHIPLKLEDIDITKEDFCMKCGKLVPRGEMNCNEDGSFMCCNDCLWKDTIKTKKKKKLKTKFEAKGLSVEIKTEGVVEEEVVHLFNILVREVNRFMREEVMDRRGKELLSKLKESK